MVSEIQLGERFRKAVRGVNITTPSLIAFVELPNGVAEISRGKILGLDLFGVTVVAFETKREDLGTVFETEALAREYCEKLKGILR